MKPDLTELVSQLTPDEQAAVRSFIEFIKGRAEKPQPTAFLTAIEEFIAEHPELLRRLAQ
jgi:hypothetical protein